MEPVIRGAARPEPVPDRLAEGITFENITFQYPGGTEPALAGLNLRIKDGELIALVGENGAGKSTLVKLLLRFYDPDKGSVKLGGTDIRTMDPEALRGRIGVLFQDYTNYELSIRENVT